MISDQETKTLLKPELWVQNYADIMFSYALRRVNNEEVAQDLVQEAFLGGLKSQANFDGNSSEKTWLIAILKFKIIDYYRSKNKHQNQPLHQDDGEEIDHFFFEDNGHWKSEHAIIGDFESADSALEKKEFYKVLDKCLSILPNKLATVFKLKMLIEEKSEVICEMLNITDANYWVILHRAKLQLRSCMSTNWKR
ncbi:MAG: sigma-70 family RNA polymerase sigma factor [Sphingobacteriales bacterium]|nr:sigma-70 family RNA polymerase sigma factor [Sphingobacteriales bacterium]